MLIIEVSADIDSNYNNMVCCDLPRFFLSSIVDNKNEYAMVIVYIRYYYQFTHYERY
jgi:hypothetical protein